MIAAAAAAIFSQSRCRRRKYLNPSMGQRWHDKAQLGLAEAYKRLGQLKKSIGCRGCRHHEDFTRAGELFRLSTRFQKVLGSMKGAL